MQLEDFVAETLKQVLNGIRVAQKHADENGGLVCPMHLPMRDKVGKVHHLTYREDREHLVEFDVAVTTSDGTKTGGGIGIVAGPVALGSKGESASSSANLSRVRFTVPVVYPKQSDPTLAE